MSEGSAGIRINKINIAKYIFCLAVTLAMLVSSSRVFAGEKPWIEVRSSHFRVLTDGSEKDGRRVAREFEQMRSVFTLALPNARLDSGAPLLILATHDDQSFKALAPALWNRKGAKPAGFFTQGWERKFAVVRLDAVNHDSRNPYEVVYHEYTHSIMHMTARWLPVWMDEGLATFYGYSRFEKDKIFLGAPDPNLFLLRTHTLIPVETLIGVDQRSPYYHDEDKVHLFYAESWTLIHYLMFSPQMEQGKRLQRFFEKLTQGVEQKRAFRETIGEFNDIEMQLSQYVSRLALTAEVIHSPPQIDENQFTIRRLTMAETNAELGSFEVWQREPQAARAQIEAAVKEDASLASAHEALAFLRFGEGKDEEARQEFDRAFQLNDKLYLSLFYRTMLSPLARSADPADRQTFYQAMMKVLELNEQFAPAYIELAGFYIQAGDLQRALGLSRKAEQLEPSRAGYHILSGNILYGLGRYAEAANFAKYVADRWQGPDHDEAMELWEKIPQSSRPSEPPIEAVNLASIVTQTMSGTLKSIKCREKDEAAGVVVIEHDGTPFSFQYKTGFRGGFSDTLWFGEDHFSYCHHLLGLRAVVRYTPSADKNFAGELREVDIRQDFPIHAPTQPSAKESNSTGLHPE